MVVTYSHHAECYILRTLYYDWRFAPYPQHLVIILLSSTNFHVFYLTHQCRLVPSCTWLIPFSGVLSRFSILLQMAMPHFSELNNIPLHIFHMFFIHSSISSYWQKLLMYFPRLGWWEQCWISSSTYCIIWWRSGYQWSSQQKQWSVHSKW